DKLKPGDIIEVLSDNPSTQHDLPAWVRLTANHWLGTDIENGRSRHRIEKGTVRRVLTDGELDWGNRAPISEGRFEPRHWPVGPSAVIEQTAKRSDGFAPRGARVESGSPEFPFDVVARNQAWSEGAAEVYDQATAAHWDGSRDIPWRELRPLDEDLERAVC